MKRTFALTVLLASLNIATAQEPVIGQHAPTFTGKDSAGNEVSLAGYAGKLVVLEWINPGCPFVKKHYSVGNMQGLQSNYTAKGVIWLSIASSAEGKQGYFNAEEWTKLIQEQGIAATAVVLDADGVIGKAYGAKNTPFMAIVGTDGTLIYQGGIDDKASTESSDIATSVNYVAAALDEALAGKPVTIATSQPYGCGVKYAD